MEDFMKKRSLFVSIAAMSLLMAGLIGCGGKPAEESKPVESQPEQSQPAGTSALCSYTAETTSPAASP